MISSEEVRQVLLRIGRHEIVPRPKRGNWEETWGDIAFDCAGWEIVIFNDCGEFDYVERAVSPDGREANYFDWTEGDPGRHGWNMDDEEERQTYHAMVRAFEQAR